MQKPNMRYGRFLRTKRLSDDRELTLRDVADALGVSVTFVSDVEHGRRLPYDEIKTQKLIKYLHLSEEDVATMYSRIPRDLDEIMMYSDSGEMARFALRMTKKGVINEDDWSRFIYYIKIKEKDND